MNNVEVNEEALLNDVVEQAQKRLLELSVEQARVRQRQTDARLLEGAGEGIHAGEQELERFNGLIAAALAVVNEEVVKRRTKYKGTYYSPEANHMLRVATDKYVALLDGKLQREESLERQRERYSEMLRIERERQGTPPPAAA
jgi:hypothetical protein